MQGPLSAFEDWFHAQPYEIRNDTVIMALALLPGIGLKPDDVQGDDWTVPFLRNLEAHAQDCSAREQVATALSIRAAMNFFLVRTKGVPEAWVETQEIAKRLADDAIEQRPPESFLRDILRQVPQGERLWRLAADQWREVASNAFADSTLAAWLDPSMRWWARDTRRSPDEYWSP